MRRTAAIALVLLATLAGASPALATPAQDSFGVTQARADASSLDGDGAVVAVIDSGVDATHPALDGRVIGFHDLVNHEQAAYDDLGHGTWVAGIIAGQATAQLEAGAAPAARIVAVKVTDEIGDSTLQTIANGIDWAVDHRAQYGIDVINLSVGDPAGGDGDDDVAELAVQRAVDAGIVVVAAAGNLSGLGHIATPASADNAIAVAAMVDPGSPAVPGGPGFRPFQFSSSGPAAGGDMKPDLSAAAVHRSAWAADLAGVEGAGTSGAAAFASGVAALMLDANPSLTPAAVKQALMATAEDWGRPGPDEDYGAGRMDAYAALHAVGAPLATPPAVPDHLSIPGAATPTDHPLTVASAGRPLAVTLIPAGADDLDLRLEGPGGLVATAATSARRETLALTAAPAGDYTLRVTGAPGGGYRLDVSGMVAAVDATAPALTLDALPAHTTDTSPALSGQAGSASGDFAGVVARVFSGGTQVRALRAVPLPDGSWSADPGTLPDGTYEVRAEQGDRRHNVTLRTGTFTIDTTPPVDDNPSPPAGEQSESPPPDTDDPALGLAAPLPRGIAALRGRGVSVGFRCDEACTIRAELTVTAKLARRHKLAKRLAAADAAMTGAGTVTLKLKPSSAVRKRLKRVKSLTAKLTVVATDAAGNESRLSRSLRLR